ncbi:MAG: ThiF family adenylyltransferase, partial [Bifidobacteriaceae bacterium]|nr:ThiF family adenylyltransferase [Bifidobacteriaceae bacterium]
MRRARPPGQPPAQPRGERPGQPPGRRPAVRRRGLGAPAAMYLAAAGVGVIGLADADKVDLSNLQRQIIHGTGDVGKAKVASAAETIAAMNPDVETRLYHEWVDSRNIMDIIADQDYDFIIDGTDNFPVKFLINDACV